ncbi:hypothetical protein FN846DRAFT_894730 [Sphaerosporella brunnea]|uniref:Uncharacterized protein n=1 Tax=Sphaerosporella brunnea TaxID=1250544 RepID=A0A5J5EHV2_9PEZI|nr:hypothetical protein FN846DRAFT_894730 [Sphaerosporella brunnea]
MASSVEGGEMEKTGVANGKAISAEHRQQNRPDFAENTAGLSEERDASAEKEKKAAFGVDKVEAKRQERHSYGEEKNDTGCTDERWDPIRMTNSEMIGTHVDFSKNDRESSDYKIPWHNRMEFTTTDDGDSGFNDESLASDGEHTVDAGQVGNSHCLDRGSHDSCDYPCVYGYDAESNGDQGFLGSQLHRTATDNVIGERRRSGAIHEGLQQFDRALGSLNMRIYCDGFAKQA